MPMRSLKICPDWRKSADFAFGRDRGRASLVTHSNVTSCSSFDFFDRTPSVTELLKYNLRSVRAHLLREDFQQFWEYVSPGWAGKFLDEWCTRTMRSQLEPMKKVARTLRNHRELLLNWFRAKGALSSGVVEGFNNKVKLTTRKSYGFRTYEAIETALYHNLGALPEPEFTHRFW
jgi:transposase